MRTFQTAGGQVEQVRFAPGGRGLALLVRERIEVEVAPEWWHKMGEWESGDLVTQVVRIDLDTGAESRTPLAPPGSWATLSADGSRTAFGLWWYEPRDGPLVRTLDPDGHTQAWPKSEDEGEATAGAFSPDGQALACCCSGMLARIDLGAGRRLPSFRLNALSVAFGPGGRFLSACLYGRSVLVWDPDGRESVQLPRPADRVEWAPTGHGAGVDGPEVWLLPPDDRAGVRVVRPGDEPCADLAFTPDGRRLLTAGPGGRVAVWDVATGELVRDYDWGLGAARCVAVSPDGLLAAAGGDGGRVVVWDVD